MKTAEEIEELRSKLNAVGSAALHRAIAEQDQELYKAATAIAAQQSALEWVLETELGQSVENAFDLIKIAGDGVEPEPEPEQEFKLA